MNIWWYVARASGIIAWVMLAAAVVWGILLATKILGSKPRPSWLLDLHRWLGGLSVSFTAVHITGLILDDYVDFGASDILVPMSSSWRPTAVAWGIVAMYVLVAVQSTSLAMKRMPRRLWKWVHMSSFGLFFIASVHAGLAGTDVTNRVYQATSVMLVSSVVFMAGYRVLGATRRRTRPTPDRSPDRTTVPAEA